MCCASLVLFILLLLIVTTGNYIGTPPWRKRSHAEAELELDAVPEEAAELGDSEPELDPLVALAMSNAAEITAASDPYTDVFEQECAAQEEEVDEELVGFAATEFAKNSDDDEEDGGGCVAQNAFAEEAEEEHEEHGFAQDDGYGVIGAEELAAVDELAEEEEQEDEQFGQVPEVSEAEEFLDTMYDEEQLQEDAYQYDIPGFDYVSEEDEL